MYRKSFVVKDIIYTLIQKAEFFSFNSKLLRNYLLLFICQNENVHVNPLEKCLLNNSQFLLPELAFCIFPLAIFSELCIHTCLNSYIF